MKPSQFEHHILPLIEKDLRGMPCVWFTENNADNAWDMLVELWPDNEPGMGVWDHIQGLIRNWIAALLENQPLDDLRQYWEDRTDTGRKFDRKRAWAETFGTAASHPPLEELCRDIANVLLGDVLSRAEEEGCRRQEELDES